VYGFNIELDDSFDNAVKRVTEALKTEGFGVLTEIETASAPSPARGQPHRDVQMPREATEWPERPRLDPIGDVQKTTKEKPGVEGRPYRILGACNPPLAHRAITADPDIGLLLPCNVVVREEPNKKINVGFMDPVAVLKLTNNPGITEVAKEVRGKLERVRDRLKG
jgi:uncharacterized protein (DUF302 family)